MARWIFVWAALWAATARAETNEVGRAPGSLKENTWVPGDVPADPEAEKPPEMLVFGLQEEEARLIISDLTKKNEHLRKENLDLREQVRKLTHSLAAEKARADELLFQQELADVRSVGLGFSKPLSMTRPIRLVDVNEQLHVAVLDAGRAEGFRTGMEFSVQRRGKFIARLRALDVRERLTGAEVVAFNKGDYPAPGDRAIPVVTGEQ